MFSQDSIQTFQMLFYKEFGYEISLEEAEKYAEKLIDLLTTTYKNKQENYEKS